MANAKIQIPDVREILTTGMQFGHSTSRWNPKMSDHIFGVKEGVHIIDVVRSRELLEKAAEVVFKAASEGEVIFVGTKRQAADMIIKKSMEAGAHFVASRWAGGLFTNFPVVKKSLARLRELEKLFEEGVEGRTKYEVVKMKDEWRKLNRLYEGVKLMDKLPKAMIVVDPNYDKVAIREARKSRIPVIALIDTNSDPDMVDYPVPGNDDALRSIELFMNVMADATLKGNEGKGVRYTVKDYTEVDVKLVKKQEEEVVEAVEPVEEVRVVKHKASGAKSTGKGILEAVKEGAESEKKSKE